MLELIHSDAALLDSYSQTVNIKALVTMAIPLSPAFFASYTTNPAQMKRSWYVFFFQSPYAEEAFKNNDYEMIDVLWKDWCPDWKAYDNILIQ